MYIIGEYKYMILVQGQSITSMFLGVAKDRTQVLSCAI